MILIYSDSNTSRLRYVAQVICADILQTRVEITDNKEEFLQFQSPKVNYSFENLDGLIVRPNGLLFETGVRQYPVEVSHFGEFPVLFASGGEAVFPFDVFSASFYMLTRYEEYLPHQLDKHGRSIAENSLAYIHGFLEIPVVDHWACKLCNALKKLNPGYSFPNRQYQHIPTIDVDIAWAYRNRSFLRIAGAIAKAVVQIDFEDNNSRLQTLIMGKPDPFDQFAMLKKWFADFKLQPVLFFLLGNYGSFDKGIHYSNDSLRKLINNLHQDFAVGIHPSYASNENPALVGKEISRLKGVINEDVVRSRQHFLKLRMPQTYQVLLSNGITEDYSMGYASQPGFRAGTCTPYPFYDLTTETQTKLIIFPFQVMDGTLNQYLKLNPDEAIDRCRKIIAEIKKVDGTFVSLWHNESLSEMRDWKGWRLVYNMLLEASR